MTAADGLITKLQNLDRIMTREKNLEESTYL